MILSLSGFKGSGKGTVSKILQDEYGFVEYSFSTKLKDIVSHLFSWDRELIEGITEESREWRETEDEYWTKKLGYSVTPRKILTKLGTDIFRNNLHKDFWIFALEKQISQDLENGDRIVIERCSYPNELKFVNDLGGYNILVDRYKPEWYDLASIYNELTDVRHKNAIKDYTILRDIHDSEYAFIGYNFYFFIDNKGDIENLINETHKLMEILL